MKKSLLFAAFALAAATASADYTEYFTVSYHGEPVANGATIVVSQPEREENGMMDYLPHINVEFTNLDAEEPTWFGGSYWYDTPGRDECIGTASICSNANCYPANANPDNIGELEALDILLGDDAFEWQPHLEKVPADKKFTQTYRLTMCVKEENIINTAGDVEYLPIEGSEFTMYIKYTNEGNAIGEIDVETAAPEYFNLQGVKVAEPENGLYIVKRGAKVSKEMIRK